MGGSQTKSSTNGLRVIKISQGAPVTKTDLSIYLDFIVDVKNAPLNFNIEHDFYKYIIENENNEIELLVYNILTKSTRVIKLLLTRNWPNSDFLLGFKIRYESIFSAEKNLYRVLSILNENLTNSIKPHTFFFIAVNDFIFEDLEDLKIKLQLHNKCDIVFFDIENEKVVLVPLVYDMRRGLGFEIGSGYLHDLSFIYQAKLKNKMQQKSYQLNEGIKKRNKNFSSNEEITFERSEFEMQQQNKDLENIKNLVIQNIDDNDKKDDVLDNNIIETTKNEKIDDNENIVSSNDNIIETTKNEKIDDNDNKVSSNDNIIETTKNEKIDDNDNKVSSNDNIIETTKNEKIDDNDNIVSSNDNLIEINQENEQDNSQNVEIKQNLQKNENEN